MRTFRFRSGMGDGEDDLSIDVTPPFVDPTVAQSSASLGPLTNSVPLFTNSTPIVTSVTPPISNPSLPQTSASQGALTNAVSNLPTPTLPTNALSQPVFAGMSLGVILFAGAMVALAALES